MDLNFSKEMTIGIFTHPDCLKHDTGLMHPENAGRITAIIDALNDVPFADKLQIVEAPLAKEEYLFLAHDPEYIDKIINAAPSTGTSYLDADTIMSEGTLAAALRAVGAACSAVDNVVTGTYKSAFCAMRPPGHHATRDRAMGFCIFNNIAIAALYALEYHDFQRVAIIDFDVHHGNGTEDILRNNEQVFYISTHQSPLFPHTGFPKGNKGNILNVPLPQNTTGQQYREVFEKAVIPALEKFKPQLLLISAGFDGHRDDPLAGLNLVEDDYQWIGEQLNMLAQKCCSGKIVSVLEGGYNHQALAQSVVAYLSAFNAG